jgi:hypothetical protein
MFRIVFWDVLPCKIIVDRRFRVCTASIITHPWWWRQYAPLKHRLTIILHGSTSQKTILNIILAAVRTWNLTSIVSFYRLVLISNNLYLCILIKSIAGKSYHYIPPQWKHCLYMCVYPSKDIFFKNTWKQTDTVSISHRNLEEAGKMHLIHTYQMWCNPFLLYRFVGTHAVPPLLALLACGKVLCMYLTETHFLHLHDRRSVMQHMAH